MSWLEIFELLSYVVTFVGLPLAIVVYLIDKKKERDNEDEEIYQKLADEYTDFLKLVLKNSDLQLRAPRSIQLTPEQEERKIILFDVLVSLFERSYILAYEEKMNRQQHRRWLSWEDWMLEWCRREDFRNHLPKLLEGEDPEFVNYIATLAKKIDPAFILPK